jgi:hypothetical protein
MFKNVSSPVEINRFTVDEIVNYIENNPDQLIIKQAREFVKRFGKDCIQYQKIKHQLPVVSWAGTFKYRNTESIEEFSNLMYFDIDNLEDETKLNSVVGILNDLDFVYAYWQSVSQTGLGILIRTKHGLNKDNFKPTWIKYYELLNAALKDIDVVLDWLPDYTRVNILSSSVVTGNANSIEVELEESTTYFNTSINDITDTIVPNGNMLLHICYVASNAAYKRHGAFLYDDGTCALAMYFGMCNGFGIEKQFSIDYICRLLDDKNRTIERVANYIYKSYEKEFNTKQFNLT